MSNEKIDATKLLEWLDAQIQGMDEESEYSRASAFRYAEQKVLELIEAEKSPEGAKPQ